MNMRKGILIAAACVIGVALLILWLGYRYDRETDRLVAEGQLVQGRLLSQTFGSCSSNGSSGEIAIGYDVGGVAYRRTMLTPSCPEREPVFKAERIRVPRLGPGA